MNQHPTLFTDIHGDARLAEDKGDEKVTCCLHLALHHQQSPLCLHGFSVRPFLACKAWLWRAGTLKQVRCCVRLCLYMHSESCSDLRFGFNCCVNLSSTLMGCLPLMLLTHVTSVGQSWSVCCRHAAAYYPNNNHILIAEPYRTCLMEAHPNSSTLCITFARKLPQ